MFEVAAMPMEIEDQAVASLTAVAVAAREAHGASAEVIALDPRPLLPTVVAIADAEDAIACGPLWVSPNEMCEVRIAGRRVPMSLCHLKMLACLLEARGRVVSRQELYRASGATDLPEGSRRVDVHVTRIRRALGALGSHLVAVRRRGYRLDTTALARLT